MRVALLGPVAVVEGERATPVSGEKQRTLLALLALAAGEPVSADVLVDELWPGAVPADPANALQARVSAVRKVVGAERLRSSGVGYVLDVSPDDVDACRFERLVDSGLRNLDDGDHASAASRLDEAVSLWAGDVALADVRREGRVQLAAERLEDLLANAHEGRINADLALGRHERAATELRGLVARYPLRERLREQLMLALYRSGRQADALAAFQDARETFLDELGLDPGPSLVTLEGAILRHDSSLLPGPAARSTIRRPLTSFVGRAAELDGVAAALAQARLVTLVGPGGVGKTRLATEIALRSELTAWWVALDTVNDGAGVLPAVAAALGIGDDQVDAWIGERPMLLVLDNCEQVVGAVASVVEELLGRAPAARVLATSREVLGIPGERVWTLDGLSAEDATALFEARAPASAGDGAVPSLCADLDGLPLAIELAAARTNVLSPADIASRLGDRFSVLSDGGRTAAPRHQTLRALVDWSYELLFDDERRALAALSVFRNPFSVSDAEAVCVAVGLERVDIVDVVGRLVAKSLVVADRGTLRLLVTIRDYGAERLDELGLGTEVRGSHAAHLASLAASVGPSLLAADQLAALDLLSARDDDLHAAFDWCFAAHDHETALSLADSLGWYWFVRGTWGVARRRLVSVLEDPSGDVAVRSRALGWLAHFALVIDADLPAALAASSEQRACAVATGDAVLQARANVNIVRVHVMGGDLHAAEEPLREAASLLEGRDEPFWLGMCRYFESVLALAAGRVDVTGPLISNAVELFRRSGERWSLYNALLQSGTVFELSGRLPEAAAQYGEALVNAGALRFRGAEGNARVRLARVSESLGDADGAVAVCAQCLDLGQELDDGYLLNHTRIVLARVARTAGRLEEADAHTAAVMASPQIRNRDMFAFGANERGYVLALAGRADDALSLHRDALREAASHADKRFVAMGLVGVAGCLADRDPARAAMLLGAGDVLRGGPVPGVGAERAYSDGVSARARRALGPRVYEEAVEAGRLLGADDAIELALHEGEREPSMSTA